MVAGTRWDPVCATIVEDLTKHSGSRSGCTCPQGRSLACAPQNDPNGGVYAVS